MMETADAAGWLDVTVPITPGMVLWPGDPPVELTRLGELASGDPANLSRLAAGLHSGTHVDAPSHYLAGGATIDQMPVAAMIGPARVIAVATTGVVDRDDLSGLKFAAGERVLLRTGNSELYRRGRFCRDYLGLTEAAAAWLAGQGLQTLGIDYLSVAGLSCDQAAVHKRLLEAGVWIIEGLNLRWVEFPEACFDESDQSKLLIPRSLLRGDSFWQP
ncbi:cyclase/hydrolase [Desulfuromonas sp. DDH964]|uniref:cyclase family protein n=1 Tax=Desulfuromonas sp. DDH964 TaxID=1823759 RepID=UPI00078E9B2F|nr:cyclase family protein [Desulfuromonas sp. DDH964]AMV70829.1 cyclase/hydrolase [Desulfuromonas sp. DDH964]